jgi:hypothetical protein
MTKKQTKSKQNKKAFFSPVWWCMPTVPALRRLSKEDCELQASLDFTGRCGLKKQINKSTTTTTTKSNKNKKIASFH